MTPQEKAIQLIDRYLDIENYNNLNLDLFCDECGMNIQSAKYCALIALDECIKAVESDWSFMETRIEYWKEVRKEVERYTLV